MSGALSRMTDSWRTAAGTAPAATVGLGLLLLACVLVAAAGPRANTQLQTNAVRQLLARTPANAKVIEASIPYSQAEPAQNAMPVGQIAEVQRELRVLLGKLPLSPASTDTAVFTSAFTTVEDSARSLGPGGGTRGGVPRVRR